MLLYQQQWKGFRFYRQYSKYLFGNQPDHKPALYISNRMDPNQTQVYTTILIICGAFAVFTGFFVVSILRQQKRHIHLQKKHLQEELRALEKDRTRIAADLHDELGPMLSAVKMKISSFELEDEGDNLHKEKTIAHIDSALTRMREISFDLMPRTLLSKGLVAAIRQFISFISNEHGMRIEFNHDEEVKLSEDKSIQLYRMVQELVQNAIRHSGASLLTIDLRQAEGKLTLKVKDNGKGFNKEEELKRAGGFGLHNLYNRTELMKGDMYVDTAKGKGTSYSFEIPTA
jgi:signal transduction histidine kinase